VATQQTSARTAARPTTRRSPGRPPAADSAETRASVLRAARICVARDGYDKTTNRDVADEAGISAGTIYHYFPSKPALFVAVGDHVATTFFDRFEEAVAGRDLDFRAQTQLLLELLQALMRDDPATVAFMAVWPIEVSRHEEIRALADGDGLGDAIDLYRQRAEQALRRRELARGTDPAAVAAMVTALLFGLALLVQAGHAPDLADPAATALSALVSGRLFS
jgi:AcrR family transcriptional regulator